MSPDSAQEHVADSPVTGGGRELIGSRDRPPASSGHHFGRFRWAIVGLFALAVGSLAAAVVLSSSDRHATLVGGSGAAWSAWRPPDNGLTGAQDIADYLAPYYRATPASQLAVVTVVNLNNPNAPVQVVVPAGSSGAVLPLPASSTIVYNLCGEGSSNCSIGAGTPSSNRLLLLRREALELALYTFKYIGGTQFVVALLPPGYTLSCTGSCARTHRKPTVKPLDLAVAFERSELSPWLARPLRATLPEALPPTVSQIASSREAELVSVLTSHGMYSENTASAQDGSTVITLSGPLQPQ
jgi:hypothetical protein